MGEEGCKAGLALFVLCAVTQLRSTGQSVKVERAILDHVGIRKHNLFRLQYPTVVLEVDVVGGSQSG